METVTLATLLVFSGCVCVSSVNDPIYPEISGNSFTNLVETPETLFIGAKNKLIQVRKNDLSKINEVSTCTGGSCNSDNQVLVYNNHTGDLLTCGTGNDGHCFKRSVSEFPEGVHEVVQGSPTVSNSTARPAVAYYVPGTSNLYFGVTYGEGVTDKTATFFPLSLYQVVGSSVQTLKTLRFDDSTVPDLSQYVMYFKAGFSNEGYSYFLTNQKFSVGNNTYVSKLIELCQRDTVSGSDFHSYADIVISCDDYNLLQDAVVIETGGDLELTLNDSRAMIATFSKGTDPESPSSESAVCVYSMKEIETAVLDAKKDAIMCRVNKSDVEGEQCTDTDSRQPDSEKYFTNNIIPKSRINASVSNLLSVSKLFN